MKLKLGAITAAVLLGGSPADCKPLGTRATDAISSCGSEWMSVGDVTIGQGTDTRKGFNSAVQRFCSAANGQVVQPGGYLSMATEAYLNDGQTPATYGILGFVYFEIHNKISSAHTVSVENCNSYLLALSATGSQCWGSTNSDTKGGTWQVGNNGISYHALGNTVPPTQDAINKLFTGTALEVQSVNTGGSAPLNPWPLDSLNSVKPATCHSHNDYEQAIPLFSALSAGCSGVEADVWYWFDDLIIGHILPKLGRTLKAQYVDPLRAILDHNNGGVPGNVGVYKAAPEKTLSLLIDFKTSDTGTLDAVVAALQSLRDGGYLSHVAGGVFVQRQVTVIASGSAPFDRIAAGDGIPARDVFYDAQVASWNSQYTSTNSYYASADFQESVGNPSSASAFTQDQKNTVATHVQNAHSVGLKVRYYNLPGTYLWEPLAALGVDRLNADDMSETARLPRL